MDVDELGGANIVGARKTEGAKSPFWLVDYHSQIIVEQSGHHNADSTHDNPYCLAFRLEPFGEFAVAPSSKARMLRASSIGNG